MEEGGSSERAGQIIPGPAGKAQRAIRRKRGKDPASFNEDGEQMPTQQFIKKVFDEPPGADSAFVSEPWIFAMEYIKLNGNLKPDGTRYEATPLAEICRGSKYVKVPLLVGLVTEVKPNGLGDAMITLKDPTGTVGASVHKKLYIGCVLCACIQVGSVLILENVTAACLTKASECFVNIVMKNVLRVVPNDMTTDDIFNPKVVEDSDVE